MLEKYKTIEELEKRAASLAQTLTTYDQKRKDLEKDISDLSGIKESLVSEIMKLEEAATKNKEQADKQYDARFGGLNQKEKELEELQKELADQAQELHTLSQEIEKQAKEVSNQRESISAQRVEFDNQIKEFISLQTTSLEDIQQREQAVSQREKECGSCEEKLGKATTELQRREKRVSEQEKDLDSRGHLFKQAIEEFKKEQVALEDKLENLESRESDLAEALKVLNADKEKAAQLELEYTRRLEALNTRDLELDFKEKKLARLIKEKNLEKDIARLT